MLEVRLLGQFKVRLDGEPVEIPSRPAQSLLAYLLLRPDISHRREKLAGLLWPDSEESNARGYLRHALWRIKKAIGDGFIDADKLSISFRSEEEVWVDAHQLEQELPEELSPVLKDVASVYGGELLPGFYDDWAVLDRERYRARFEKHAQGLMEGLIESKEWGEALEWGERWIALGGAPEQAYRGLMLANAGMGDITGVAAAYERCKAVLEELGVEVSEQTQQLYESLSQGVDPTTASAAAPQPDNREYERRAVQQLLERYRAREGEFLDVPGMAIVNASAGDMTFNQQDTALLVCSALSHDLDVDPWVQRAETPAFAVSALMEVYASYPRPRVRRRIVEALAQSQGAGSDGALFDIASSDDSGEVRSEAALAVAGRGKHSEILEALAQDLGRDRGGSALAAFVAVADRFGIPEGVEGYPKLSVALTLLQIRWRYSRGLIFQRSLKIALGGGLSMAMLQVLLFVSVLISPEKFQEILEVVSLPAWIFINILTGLVWGGLFGAGLGALTSFSDEVLYRDRRWFPRAMASGFAGLIHSGFILFTASTTGTWASVTPQIYIPVYILYGFLSGAFFSFVIRDGATGWTRKESVIRLSFVSGSLLIISTITVWIAYGMQFQAENAIPDLFAFLLLSVLFPLGILMTLRGTRLQETIRE